MLRKKQGSCPPKNSNVINCNTRERPEIYMSPDVHRGQDPIEGYYDVSDLSCSYLRNLYRKQNLHPSWILNKCLFSFARDSSLGITSSYGVVGPGIESRLGREFPHLCRTALGPTQPAIQWVPGLSRWQSERDVAMTTHPQSSAEVKERVDLYLYSPSGTSWPVLRRILPLSFIYLAFPSTQLYRSCVQIFIKF